MHSPTPHPNYPPLPSPAEMAEWDRIAMRDFGMPETMLMENASREALHALALAGPPLDGSHVLLFMGGGNNGGDAAALARHLQDCGCRVLVLHTRPRSHYKGAAGYHLRLASKCGVPFKLLRENTLAHLAPPWNQPDIIVDGLLGTGFSGSLRDQTHALVRWMNERRGCAFILALDIPSGLDGMTGEPAPEAVRAHATVTFEAAKTGLHMPQAAAFTGTVMPRAIGLPAAARIRHPASCMLLDRSTAALLPALSPEMHKGTSGHVVILGGSRRMHGAPMLAALGAQRGGAGYVSMAAPESLLPHITAGHPEVMTHATGPGDGWDDVNAPQVTEAMRKGTVVVAGPGMGRDNGARQALYLALSCEERPPMVLDADALFLLAESPALRSCLRQDDILTPHPGEAARLLGVSTAAIQKDRLATTRRFAVDYPCVTVLKGAGTLVTQASLPMALSPFAVPQLAVAGSGDVLAGLIGSLLAQGLSPFNAACLGVYLHGLSGLHLQQEFPNRGNTACDIARALASAKKELSTCLPHKT